MERIEFVNDLCCNYLTIPYEGGENDFALRMLTENVANTFLPPELRRLDGEIFLYYNISGMQNMEILYGEKPIDRKVFQMLVRQLHEAMEESRELFLPGDGIYLEPAALFQDLREERWKFIYIPEGDKRADREVQKEREKLAEFLVMHVDYDDRELSETVYRFYEDICAGKIYPDLFGKNLALENTGKEKREEREDRYLSETEREEEPDDWEWESGVPESEETETNTETAAGKGHGREKMRLISGVLLCASIAGTLAAGRIMPGILLPGGAVSALLAFFFFFVAGKRKNRMEHTSCEQEVYFSEKWDGEQYRTAGVSEEAEEEERREEEKTGEKTVFMDIRKEQERKLYGIGKFRQQNIFLDKLPCLVGKDETMVDHMIADISVSRMHAKFFALDNAVWMQDLNSTNGTYHNGLRLRPNEKVMLETEDEVGLGKVQFVFR